MRLLFLISAIGVGAIASASVNFTFDTDNENWTKGSFAGSNSLANINLDTSGPATWNAGRIAGTDHAGYAFHFSPDVGGGMGSLFNGTVSLDFLTSKNGGENPFIVLMSSTDFLVLEKSHLAADGLKNYSYALNDTESWYINSSDYYNGVNATLATNTDIQNVLNDLRHIGITTDIGSGGDSTLTDNVRLDPVPEPATLTLLSLGAIAAYRRKRK